MRHHTEHQQEHEKDRQQAPYTQIEVLNIRHFGCQVFRVQDGFQLPDTHGSFAGYQQSKYCSAVGHHEIELMPRQQQHHAAHPNDLH